MKRFYILFAGLFAACLALPLLVAWPSSIRPAAADGRAVLLTATPSPTPQSCDVQFEDTLFHGDTTVDIVGEIGSMVTVTDLTTGTALTSGELMPATGHLCTGYAELNLEFALVLNHVILVESDDGSFDTKIVQAAPGSVTITPTPINSPWIVLSDCVDQTNSSTLTVNSYGWFPNSEVGFYWDDVLQTTVDANPNGTASTLFAVDLITGTHQLSGLSISQTISLDVVLPCKYIVTPEPPTMTPYPVTPTPVPADLQIGLPLLISTPPINAYSPVSFTVAISNTSAWDVDNLFFVDLFFDPPPEAITSQSIDLNYSSAYRAVSSLAAGTTKVITITSDIGFTGMAPTHTVYAMVDSSRAIWETNENNNIDGPVEVNVIYVTPITPTPGNGTIAGTVFTNIDDSWQPQGRAAVYLYEQDGDTRTLIAQTASQLETGYYTFTSLSENAEYMVIACFNYDNQEYVGLRTTSAPNQFLNIYMIFEPMGCPSESGPPPTPQPTPSSTPEHAVSGRVTNLNAAALANISVTAYRWDGEWWRWAAATTTTANGTYAFTELQAGSYRFNFYDPAGLYEEEFYDDAQTLETAADVYINGFVEVKNIDAILSRVAPPVTIETGTGSTYVDLQSGTIVILQPWGQRSDIVVEAAVSCAGDTIPTNVVLETSGENYPMVETEEGVYEATIPAADVGNGLTISITYECNGESKTQVVGAVQLYDPSGVITHALTGEPLAGATVTLYSVPGWTARTGPEENDLPDSCESNDSKPAGQPWNQPAPVELGVLLTSNSGLTDPAVNRQTTSTDGRYGWDVAAGCWFVIVERSGYETLISPVVGVPPAVTDLDLTLQPQYHTLLPLFVHP